MANRKFLDLILVSAVALITLGMAFLGVREVTEFVTLPRWFIPAGILMTMVLPGYAVVVGFLPPLSGPLTFLLSLALSICFDVVGGLLLDVFASGLQVSSWAIWLSGITLLGCGLAAVRRIRNPSPQFSAGVRLFPGWGRFFIYLLALGIGIFAMYIDWQSANLAGSAFTQLWAVPVSTDAPFALQIGVQNHEREVKRYNIYVESSGKRIIEWSNVEIQSEATWTTALPFDELPSKPINVFLFLADAPAKIYRTVSIAPEAFKLENTPQAP